MAGMDNWSPKDFKLPPPLPPIVRWPLWVRLALYHMDCCRWFAMYGVWGRGVIAVVLIVIAIIRPQFVHAATILVGYCVGHAFLAFRAIRWVDRHDSW